jgi:hypothetical protein
MGNYISTVDGLPWDEVLGSLPRSGKLGMRV